ncbi:hypothetical protein AB0323_00775 [Arthrobacter sp. NPDC080031]|uniref:hypothetical protein n=1 Tax=Arthrobacter sp. NPDC080031 TaxID=3155918 RepID=UPI00344EAECE
MDHVLPDSRHPWVRDLDVGSISAPGHVRSRIAVHINGDRRSGLDAHGMSVITSSGTRRTTTSD